MRDYKELVVPTMVFQQKWRATLGKPPATDAGAFRCVGMFSLHGGHQDLRVQVRVIDEDGHPLPDVPVAFSYSTAEYIEIDEAFEWSPPSYRAFVTRTKADGVAEQIQGSVVKKGQPGGVTIFVLHPKFASDHVTGLGALADHTGALIVLQRRKTGVETLAEFRARAETRLSTLEGRLQELAGMAHARLDMAEERLDAIEDYLAPGLDSLNPDDWQTLAGPWEADDE